METVILVLVGITLFVGLIIVFQLRKAGKATVATTVMEEKDKAELKQAFSQNVGVIASSLKEQSENSNKVVDVKLESMSARIKDNGESVEKRLTALEQAQMQKLEAFRIAMERNEKSMQEGVEKRLQNMEDSQAKKLEEIRLTIERNVQNMQQSNERKLSEIQKTVDEKLTSTLNERFKESFAILSTQLESVSKTVGEMTKMSEEVGSLTRVLSNVKTTGIFGEIQLGAIIEQILSPEQYAKNVVTNKASRDPVEFVIRLPGTNDEEVLLPIDSKFPYTMYTEMQKAYEENNVAEFENRKKGLIATIKNMAKDIKTKYICPPATTNFAIMFLPIEGLYAEVVKLGLVETLQKDYSVTVAGPTTMSALLNSLQMGFQTLAVQKKSADVWNVLENVKMEFKKYNDIIDGIQKRFDAVSKDFDKLVGQRTRAIERKLRDVSDIEALDDSPALDYDSEDVIHF